MYPVKTPFWLSYLYPSLTWHESRTDKCIYLTFDDGPIPIVTPFVLKTLKKLGLKEKNIFFIGRDLEINHYTLYSNLEKAYTKIKKIITYTNIQVAIAY